MPITRHDRKAELTRKGVTLRQIASEEGVNETLVSHVLAGRRITGDDAKRVMANIAAKIGSSVDEVFPELQEKTPAA